MSKVLIIVIFIILSGCLGPNRPTVKTIEEWVNNPANGLIKHRTVWGIEIEAKLQPKEYLAYKEANSISEYSSYINDYDTCLTFILTLKNNATQDNIAYYNVFDMQSFIERVHMLSFNFDENVYLSIDDKEFYPTLYTYENVSEIEPVISFNLVFSPDSGSVKSFLNSDNFDLVFTDDVFQTGVHKFGFKRKNLENFSEFLNKRI